MLDEHWQRDGHRIQRCDYTTAHFVRNVAFCVDDEHATRLVHAVNNIDRLTAERDGLRKALEMSQRALAMIISPKAIEGTTVLYAYAQAIEAETAARAALTPRVTDADGDCG